MTTSLYCDGIEEISFANGVVRLQLTQLRGNGSVPAGTRASTKQPAPQQNVA